MKIVRITFQNRRDFSAIMECESCGHQEMLTSGYDDTYYHQHVIPNMVCAQCGLKRTEIPGDHVTSGPKHDDSKVM